MRFGVISHVVGDHDSSRVLSDTIALAQLAEESGYSSFWVAQHHFGAHRGHAPSPLILLAAIAGHTDRIQLGTAVVAPGLEHPVRLAEDAAMVDALSGGRLQLGLGAGADPVASQVFGIDHADRHRALHERLHALVAELTAERLRPHRPGLRERLWLATGTDEGYRIATDLGLGILSGRRSSPNQAEDLANATRLARYQRDVQESGRTPRAGLSRVMFCASDRAAAHRVLAPGVTRWIREFLPPDRFPAGYTATDYLADRHLFAGSPGDVAGLFSSDPCLPQVTDVLVNVPQLHPDLADNAASLRRFASQVIPLLERPRLECPAVVPAEPGAKPGRSRHCEPSGESGTRHDPHRDGRWDPTIGAWIPREELEPQ